MENQIRGSVWGGLLAVEDSAQHLVKNSIHHRMLSLLELSSSCRGSWKGWPRNIAVSPEKQDEQLWLSVLPVVLRLQGESRFSKRAIWFERIFGQKSMSQLDYHVYGDYLWRLLNGEGAMSAYLSLCDAFKHYTPSESGVESSGAYHRLITGDLLKESLYPSDGNSLEGVFWIFLTTTTYEEAMLQGRELLEEKPIVLLLLGQLAGLYYGAEQLPINQLLDLSCLELSQRVLDLIMVSLPRSQKLSFIKSQS